jgi:hypothetical protein
MIQQKLRQHTLHRTFVFGFGGICASRSAFRCVRGAKCVRTIFHARVGPVQIQQQRVRTRYDELVFLHPVGYAGHVVPSDAFGV